MRKLTALFLLAFLTSCHEPLQPRIVPPSDLIEPLSAPPLYTAKTLQELAADDQLRMKLLGKAVIDANARGEFIRRYMNGDYLKKSD